MTIMTQQIKNLSKEILFFKKQIETQELKITITEMKNSAEGHSGTFQMAK